MSKRLLLICTCFILATFAIGWQAAMYKQHGEFKGTAHAVPIIRFERFDEQRNALIIGLFNPGLLPMEINRTELIYKVKQKIDPTDLVIKDYGNKPLVLDPGDTILVPLAKNLSIKSITETGRYWGQFDFRIPGQADFYSVHHRFNASQPSKGNNSAKN